MGKMAAGMLMPVALEVVLRRGPVELLRTVEVLKRGLLRHASQGTQADVVQLRSALRAHVPWSTVVPTESAGKHTYLRLRLGVAQLRLRLGVARCQRCLLSILTARGARALLRFAGPSRLAALMAMTRTRREIRARTCDTHTRTPQIDSQHRRGDQARVRVHGRAAVSVACQAARPVAFREQRTWLRRSASLHPRPRQRPVAPGGRGTAGRSPAAPSVGGSSRRLSPRWGPCGRH
jgi:hypothetical protein